jgi:hypothetical protein
LSTVLEMWSLDFWDDVRQLYTYEMCADAFHKV